MLCLLLLTVASSLCRVPPALPGRGCAMVGQAAPRLLLPLFHTLLWLPVPPETLQVVKLVNHVDAEGVLAPERDLWINSFRPVFANFSAA